MSNTPSDDVLFELIKAHFGLDKRPFDTVIDSKTGQFHDAARYRDFAAAVLAKWGTPQPVVREPLTDENVEAASRRAFPLWWNSYGFSLCGGDHHMQTPQRVYAMRGFMGGFESGYKVALTELGITQKGGCNAE